MFTLDQVVPWGRSFDEYRRMFSLTQADLDGRIVGCGDGPASFNAEATHRGCRVTSLDPLYKLKKSDIQDRIAATYDEMLEQARRNAEEFVWDSIQSVEDLGQLRLKAMHDFLEDYEQGLSDGRYVNAALPTVPFADGAFDLALCSHFLFLYSSQLGQAFHKSGLREMCRVATEVRVFPLLALGGKRSPFVDQCAEDLRRSGFDVTIETVPYDFQCGVIRCCASEPLKRMVNKAVQADRLCRQLHAHPSGRAGRTGRKEQHRHGDLGTGGRSGDHTLNEGR